MTVCASCGRSLAGAVDSFGEGVCARCGAIAPLQEAAAFERKLRMERDYGIALFANTMFMLGVSGIAKHLPPVLTVVLFPLGCIITAVVLARRHGKAAVDWMAQDAAESPSKGRVFPSALAALGRGTIFVARRLRKPEAHGLARALKLACAAALVLGLVSGLLVLVGLADFRYPRAREVAPLAHPLEVSSVRGSRFVLSDGREFEV